jgi:hypothetical protein
MSRDCVAPESGQCGEEFLPAEIVLALRSETESIDETRLNETHVGLASHRVGGYIGLGRSETLRKVSVWSLASSGM